jgi:ABC-type dipeptide/oligopeptide/nickel transport system permease component
MSRYIARRLISALATVLAVLALTYFLMFLSGDPVLLMVPDATPGQVEELRHELGLDEPLYIQYPRFLSRVLRGDFGESFTHHLPALPIVLDRMEASTLLVVASMLVSVLTGLPLGIASALRRGSALDKVGSFFVLLGQSMPIFWTGIILIMLFAVRLRWLPTSGYGTARHLVMPAITLGLFSTARIARVMRSSLLEVLGEDYVRTARSKGLREPAVIGRHALKNAFIPVLTVLGLRFSETFGGAVVIETVFAWPGIGSVILLSVLRKDFPLMQASVFIVSLVVIACNMAVDLAYSYLDPRIRY